MRLPEPARPPAATRTPPWAVALLTLLSVGLLGGVGLLAWAWWTPALDSAASTSTPPRVTVSSGPLLDPTASAALVALSQSVSTLIAPTSTPAPPTPTYPISTAIPNVICGTWVPLGDVCEWPMPPKPTPTPVPDCPVKPREVCVWRGSLEPVVRPGVAS